MAMSCAVIAFVAASRVPGSYAQKWRVSQRRRFRQRAVLDPRIRALHSNASLSCSDALQRCAAATRAHSIDEEPLAPQLHATHSRTIAIIPTNLKGLHAAATLHQQLESLDFADAHFLAAPETAVCVESGLPCLYTRRCLHTAFAMVLCAKILAVARLYEVGADIFVTDSDVAFFRKLQWAHPTFRTSSIVGMEDVWTGLVEVFGMSRTNLLDERLIFKRKSGGAIVTYLRNYEYNVVYGSCKDEFHPIMPIHERVQFYLSIEREQSSSTRSSSVLTDHLNMGGILTEVRRITDLVGYTGISFRVLGATA